MMKPVLSCSLLCALLCGPAVADSTTTYVVELATKTQKHVVFVTDHSCGEIQLKSPQRESFLRVCATAADTGKHVRLDLDRRVRDNHDEARQAAVVIASPGATFDVLDGKLSLSTR